VRLQILLQTPLHAYYSRASGQIAGQKTLEKKKKVDLWYSGSQKMQQRCHRK
jgi:hypothetical protein